MYTEVYIILYIQVYRIKLLAQSKLFVSLKLNYLPGPFADILNGKLAQMPHGEAVNTDCMIAVCILHKYKPRIRYQWVKMLSRGFWSGNGVVFTKTKCH